MTEGSGTCVAGTEVALVGVGVGAVEEGPVVLMLDVGCVDGVDAVAVAFVVVVPDGDDNDPLGVVMSAEDELLESGDGLRGAEPPNRRSAAAAAASRGAVTCPVVAPASLEEVGEVGFGAEEVGVVPLTAPGARLAGTASVTVPLDPTGVGADGGEDPFAFGAVVGVPCPAA
jgi:hypothetical protein